ncbi:MAG: hemolysin III family protein [Pseudomonadota bacterium]
MSVSVPTFPSHTAPERRADFIIHAISLSGYFAASALLLRTAFQSGDASLMVSTGLYSLAVLASILVSFAYHLLPRHDWRAQLRRWDHAAIYTVIAGTFSPLLLKANTTSALAILAAIWALAFSGVWFKLSGDNGDSRWSLASYLGLGAFSAIALPDFWAHLPPSTTYAVGAGALFYTIGTAFYRRKGMPYRYPIWHAFGAVGGFLFFVAVWIAVAA